MTIRLISGLLFLFLSSCHAFKEYNEDSFPNHVWASGKEITFKPTIQDITKTYKLTLGLRHVHGVRLNSLSVQVKSISPSGKEETKNYTFEIMDSSNQYKGKCSGDICDVETLISENIKFEASGEYKFIVKHNNPSGNIPGMLGLGLIMDEQ